MKPLIPHSILNNTFQVSAERCIFWEEEKTLLLSDLHLGKTGHFRKSGIAVPQGVFKEDMQRLVTQLQRFKPDTILIIGDMFHSSSNKEHDFFLKWRKDFQQLSIVLVKGNHDILEESWYRQAGIQLFNEQLKKNDFIFTHDINDCDISSAGYIFSGHIHPGISIKGMSKQSLHFPCYYFGEKYAVLPAFSRFTGTHSIRPKRGENIYALVENNVMKIQ